MINAYYLTQEFNVSGRSEHFDKLVINAFNKAPEDYFEKTYSMKSNRSIPKLMKPSLKS